MTYKECESMLKLVVKYVVLKGPKRLNISPLKILNLNLKSKRRSLL